ncbi:mucin-6 [Platysternon megacephalum]|uniref:Mucin-6 n=1 Tax=Platysternon megacephalum TaxID=55544 RepID=A0A4D9DLY2_9SAUR|nr:mucin-6 [Platysternon megacephalum]
MQAAASFRYTSCLAWVSAAGWEFSANPGFQQKIGFSQLGARRHLNTFGEAESGTDLCPCPVPSAFRDAASAAPVSAPERSSWKSQAGQLTAPFQSAATPTDGNRPIKCKALLAAMFAS